MVKLNCLTLAELENEPISKKAECSFKTYMKASGYSHMFGYNTIQNIYIFII